LPRLEGDTRSPDDSEGTTMMAQERSFIEDSLNSLVGESPIEVKWMGNWKAVARDA
jgi:hypothetical protein